jgi:hypothetical protein
MYTISFYHVLVLVLAVPLYMFLLAVRCSPRLGIWLKKKKRKSQKTPSCFMQSLLDKTNALLHLSPFLSLHMLFMLVSFVACCHHHPSMRTLLIIGITATTPTSGEAVLNPPDEETEKS